MGAWYSRGFVVAAKISMPRSRQDSLDRQDQYHTNITKNPGRSIPFSFTPSPASIIGPPTSIREGNRNKEHSTTPDTPQPTTSPPSFIIHAQHP